ncbi:hypothetical protein WJX73_004070 [Symbiochloris irregularis]|uniref:THO complex subunit 2 n=1 Tax=Symbiochloris irregularis TaxID=706552 RepID=A0AAW1PZC4_9CHLO
MAQAVTAKLLSDLNSGKVVASDVGATITGIDSGNREEYLVQLALAVANGSLEPGKFPVAVKAAGLSDCPPFTLAFVLWVASLHVDKTSESEQRGRLGDLTKALLLEHMVARDYLQEIMESDFLQDAGIATVGGKFDRIACTKMRTKIFYSQSKYNLMREDSEGYAKLAVMLARFGRKLIGAVHAVAEVKQLIGIFSLDPNRVCDLVYDAYECFPGQDGFLQVLQLFGPAAMLHILGHKFQLVHKNDTLTPVSLCRVAASVIKAEMVPMEGLLGHLAPTAAEAKTTYDSAIQDLRAAMAGIGATKLGQDNNKGSLADAAMRENWKAEHLQLDVSQIDAEFAARYGGRDQKLRLVEGLIIVGDWERALVLMKILQPIIHTGYAVACFATALCTLAQQHLQPTLAGITPDGGRHTPLHKPPVQHTEPEIGQECHEMLQLLGLQVYHNVQLVVDLTRVVRWQLSYHIARLNSSSPGVATLADQGVARAINLINRCLLPAVALLPDNPSVGQEVWQVVQLLQFNKRCEIYAAQAAQQKNLLLSSAGKLATVALRRVFARLHVDDDKRQRGTTMRPYARVISKIALSSSHILAEHIINRIEDAPNLIAAVLDATKALPPMAYDMLTWAILARLSQSVRSKVKSDGTSIADWLQNLAAFAGQAAGQTAGHKIAGEGGLDIPAICQYFVSELKEDLKGEASYDMLVLKELISSMTGVTPAEDVTEVEALAGGAELQQWLLHPQGKGRSKVIKNGIAMLLKALQQGPPPAHTLVPLLILLSQQMSIIAARHGSNQLKFIADQFDKCQQILYQYIKFLSTVMTPERYAAVLPPLREMAQDYGLPPEVVFAIYRPLLVGMHPPLQAVAEDGEIEGAAAGGEGPEAQVAQHHGLAWDQVVEVVKGMVDPATWRSIHPSFYITFWTYTYPDIHYPEALYDSTMASLKTSIPAAEADLDTLKADHQRQQAQKAQADRYAALNPGYGYGYGSPMYGPAAPPAEGRIVTAGDVHSMERKIERMKEVYKRLPEESKRRKRAVADVAAGLRRDCETWAPATNSSGRSNVSACILETCVMPRVFFSPEDAMMCAAFILQAFALQSFGTSFLFYIKRIISGLGVVLTCSDREAQNYGIFLRELFVMMNRWQMSETRFNEECQASAAHPNHPAGEDAVSYQQWQGIAYRFQHDICRQFIENLASKEWVHLNNTLAVLKKVLKVFPMLDTVAARLKRAALKILQTDERADLKTAANAYSCALEGEMKRPDRMLTHQQFGGAPPATKSTPASPVPVKEAKDRTAQGSGKLTLANGGTNHVAKAPVPDRATPEPGQVDVVEPGHAAEDAKSEGRAGRSALKADAREFVPGKSTRPASDVKNTIRPPAAKRLKLDDEGAAKSLIAAAVREAAASAAPEHATGSKDRRSSDPGSSRRTASVAAAAQAQTPPAQPSLTPEELRAQLLRQSQQKADPPDQRLSPPRKRTSDPGTDQIARPASPVRTRSPGQNATASDRWVADGPSHDLNQGAIAGPSSSKGLEFDQPARAKEGSESSGGAGDAGKKGKKDKRKKSSKDKKDKKASKEEKHKHKDKDKDKDGVRKHRRHKSSKRESKGGEDARSPSGESPDPVAA